MEYIKFKLILIGAPNSGKTTIIRKYIHNCFTDNYRATIGVDFAIKKIILNNLDINLQIWDLAGQERFGQYTKIYYRNTNGVLLVYDLTNQDSWEKISYWLEDLLTKIDSDKIMPILLLGNKLDLFESSPEYIADQQKFVHKNNLIGFEMISAKTGENLETSMSLIIENMLKNLKPEIDLNKIKLKPQKKPEKSCCD